MSAATSRLLRLPPNQPQRPYLGGAGIAELRGTPTLGPQHPEDFVGSTTQVFTGGGVGLSRLEDGSLLVDAVSNDPVAFLGEDHVRAFGPNTELLVKILDTAERLFVHVHPNREFARRHLGSVHGKTEAWVVTAARPGARAYLGFRHHVAERQLVEWVARQDVALLDSLNAVELHAGTTVLVPAGMPHALDPGVTLVELQEPTDFSVLLEYEGFDDLGPEDAFLGLDRAVALGSVDRCGHTVDDIAALVSSVPEGGTGAIPLLPAAAAEFFRAEWLRVSGPVRLDPGFSIIVVLTGAGAVRTAAQELAVSRGSAVLVPHGVGEVELHGEFTGVRARPPVAP